MREHHRAQHLVFRQLLGFGFDHHHGVVRAGNHEVEAAFLQLLLRGVQLVLAVLEADARRTDRAHEGHARECQGSRRGDHRHDVGLVLAVVAENLRDHVDFVVETFGEQRAHGAVDQAAGQRLMLGGAALALEEAARDAAGSGELLLIVDGQREEVLAFLHRLGGGDGAQNYGLAVGGHHGPVGLAGDLARFQGQRAAAPFDRLLGYGKHQSAFSSP